MQNYRGAGCEDQERHQQGNVEKQTHPGGGGLDAEGTGSDSLHIGSVEVYETDRMKLKM